MFVVKVPGVNSNGETKGCEKAGNAILDSLKEISVNEEEKQIDTKLLDLEEIHLDNSDLKLTNSLIYKNAFETFETKNKTVFLGGDHSVSFSLTRAFRDYCRNSRKEPFLIVFDALPNLRKNKEGFPKNDEWLRELIDEGFPIGNILLVGSRNLSVEEANFVKNSKIKRISMNRLLEDLQDACDGITEFPNGRDVYVSIDMSVVDGSFVPGVYGNSSGGLSPRELIYLVQRINKVKTLRAVDIVEVNPDKDFNNSTTKLGAKILSELV